MNTGQEQVETGHETLPYLVGWMKSKRITIRRLSALSGVSPNTITTLRKQRHQAKYDTIERLAKGIGITPDELVKINPYAQTAPEPETGAAQPS